MSNRNTDTLFLDSRASSKFFRKLSGTFTRTDGDHTDYMHTYPHELENDELFAIGWVKSRNTVYPLEVYYFSLPYVDALGTALVEVTWDETNIYVKYPWDGSSDGTGTTVTTLDYTVLCMIV